MCWAAKVFILLFQKLSGSHKALVEMQDDVSELLRSATGEYKQTKVCFQPRRHKRTLYSTLHYITEHYSTLHNRVAANINTPYLQATSGPALLYYL